MADLLDVFTAFTMPLKIGWALWGSAGLLLLLSYRMLRVAPRAPVGPAVAPRPRVAPPVRVPAVTVATAVRDAVIDSPVAPGVPAGAAAPAAADAAAAAVRRRRRAPIMPPAPDAVPSSPAA